jgi:diguanylate cyclase (GGDEF)-like protein
MKKNAELETEIKEREKAERLLKESEERFKSLSVTDQLTGLYNRRQLHNVFENEISRSKRYNRPLSIILMDVDDFKKFNDTYGHLAGDSVLNRLGQIIQSSIRGTDKGFRYGGEEFLVVLPETNGTDAIITAKRIMQTMEEEKFHPNANTTVVKTLSVGIAEYIPEEFSNDFLKRADDNMYHAKINGKNRISYQHNIIS